MVWTVLLIVTLKFFSVKARFHNPRLFSSRHMLKMSSPSYKGLVWFRETDLRIHDHKPLTIAHAECTEVVHAFCFNPTDYKRTKFGIERTSYRRMKFQAEAVFDLSKRISSLGGTL